MVRAFIVYSDDDQKNNTQLNGFIQDIKQNPNLIITEKNKVLDENNNVTLDDRSKQNILKCDIFICCLSKNFYNSKLTDVVKFAYSIARKKINTLYLENEEELFKDMEDQISLLKEKDRREEESFLLKINQSFFRLKTVEYSSIDQIQKETAVTCIVRNLDKKHNAIRLSTIILDIGTKVIRAHIQRFLDLNNYDNFNDLISNTIVSKEMLKNLKKGFFGNIPDSLDKFDITKSFALIHNVFNELHKTLKFNYSDKNYDYCKRLKNIRNQKYAHILFFEMEDIDFSVTAVTIEEIIRQLCDYDKSLYLDKIKDELDKDNCEINDVITLLLEQKEELQKLITSLSNSTDSKIKSFGDQLKELTGVVQSQNGEFIRLIDEMKNHEESRRLMFEVFLEQTVILKEIKSDTTEIKSDTTEIKSNTEEIKSDTTEIKSDITEIKSDIAEIKSTLDTITNKPDKPGVSEIYLACNLPSCPPASKLHKRENEAKMFTELPNHKLSCIAGMAGVGKSTLAITYGHYRIQVNKAKVFYFNAETEVKVADDYKSFAEKLDVEVEKEDNRIWKVNSKLTKPAETNEIIFIFDNVEDYSFIEKYICNRPESIIVVTTARNKNTIGGDKVLHIKLEPFSRDEAVKYVIKVLSENKIKREDIEELVEIVVDKNEVIPFNLNKVVSILSKSFFGKKNKKKRLEDIRNDPKLWLQTGFYDEFMKNEKIARILKFIPYFDPDSIDIELLAIICGFDSDDTSLEAALEQLLKNLLIKQSENEEQISVHRLLQKDLSEYFKNSENKETTRETFIEEIDDNFSDAYSGNRRNEYNTHLHAISLVEKK